MLTHPVPHRLTDAGRLASARNLRSHADLLRDGAEQGSRMSSFELNKTVRY